MLYARSLVLALSSCCDQCAHTHTDVVLESKVVSLIWTCLPLSTCGHAMKAEMMAWDRRLDNIKSFGRLRAMRCIVMWYWYERCSRNRYRVKTRRRAVRSSRDVTLHCVKRRLSTPRNGILPLTCQEQRLTCDSWHSKPCSRRYCPLSALHRLE